MQAALGVTGVEGAFRSACQVSMQVLREHKPTLLALLDAFVYDPLVSVQSFGNIQRKIGNIQR
jgi:phosphatidylinositol kinase/protein kinase (PI-3  family)